MMDTWVLAGILAAGMLTFVLLVRLSVGYIRSRRQRSARRKPPRPRRPVETSPEVGTDIRELTARLDELASGMEQRIEARAGQLEELLDRADEKLRELREQTGQTPRPPSDTGPGVPADQTAILRLSQQGLDAVQIAQRLAMDVGKVELVLNLQRSSMHGVGPREPNH